MVNVTKSQNNPEISINLEREGVGFFILFLFVKKSFSIYKVKKSYNKYRKS